jgi:uncharacterized repeat protein (TIGR01451 family)
MARASVDPALANSLVSWTVTFNAPVTGVDASDFVLVQSGGASGAAITGVTGSGSTWTVTASTGESSTGTVGLNLVDDDTIVSTVDGNKRLGGAGKNNGSFTTGPVYTLALPWPVLGKTASSASAVLNGVVMFTITAKNNFGVALNNVKVTDVLPTGMTYQAAVPTSGSVAVSGQTVTWDIPTIDPTSTAQLSLAVKLTQKGVMTNTVTSPGSSPASAQVLVLANAVTHYKFDAPAGSWTGAANEVVDSGGTNLHGRRLTTTTPTSTNEVVPNPTIASQFPASVIGGFCNAGYFDGKGVVTVGSSTDFRYTTTLSATAWIYPTKLSTTGDRLNSILSNDTNYEFHLDQNQHLYWWWNADSLTSDAVIPLNKWTHIAITMDSSSSVKRQRIYINGVLDNNTKSWSGTLQQNNCPFYIGGDISTGSNCSLLSDRNFQGIIDEVKLYNFELGADEVVADMNLGRLCSGTFDHVRIEHDGVASVCSPKTVTIKACLDANCNTLYPGDVKVNLKPSTYWVGGDSITIKGGIASAQLSSGTSGDVTLGVSSADPVPAYANIVHCFKNGVEDANSCTLNFASTSCNFDAVEASSAASPTPGTPLYTKLSGVAFKVDVLPLSNSTTINSNYVGSVTVDLVDTSSNACPSSTGLSGTSQALSFNKDKKKTVTFNYPDAAPNVKVRMRVGTSAPACSSDNFAIRPQQFSVTSSANNATLTGTPKFVAGKDAFSLTAAAGVGGGYKGTPKLDVTKVNDHNDVVIAANALSGNFAAGTGTSASGADFKYLDVGGIKLTADAVVDNGFTGVDQPDECVKDSTSNVLTGGKYGCNIGSVASNQFGRWVPSHFSFVGTVTPGCGNFTYMGQDALGAKLTVKAHALAGATASASDPVVTRYSTDTYPNVATVKFASNNNGTAVDIARLTNPTMAAALSATKWNAGVFTIDDTFAFSRPNAPDGPYELYRLQLLLEDKASPNNDGVTLFGSPASAFTNTTRLRYGRLVVGNAYGSELLPLPIPLETQYWQSGGYYVTNRDDSCTSFNASSLILSNPTQKLALCETNLSPTGTISMLGGVGSLKLTAPGAGNSGSLQLNLNVGSSASGSTCLSSTVSNATAANLPQFGTLNPTGRATFGVRKTPLIYRRENY